MIVAKDNAHNSETGLRTILRQANASEHASLEQLVGSIDDLEQYKRYVSGISAFRIPLEVFIAQSSVPVFFGDWRPQRLTSALRQDAVDLRLEPTPTVTPRFDDSPESLLGMLYVLEGSSLGARIIYKRTLAMGLNADFGARHLAEQAGHPAYWKGFLSLLQTDQPLDANAVVMASRQTFELAKIAFSNLDHDRTAKGDGREIDQTSVVMPGRSPGHPRRATRDDARRGWPGQARP